MNVESEAADWYSRKKFVLIVGVFLLLAVMWSNYTPKFESEEVVTVEKYEILRLDPTYKVQKGSQFGEIRTRIWVEEYPLKPFTVDGEYHPEKSKKATLRRFRDVHGSLLYEMTDM